MDEAISASKDNLAKHSLTVYSFHKVRQKDYHTQYNGPMVHQFSFVRNPQTYSSVDLTMMFLKKTGFAFLKLVQSLPNTISSHYDLYHSSFEEVKSLLDTNADVLNAQLSIEAEEVDNLNLETKDNASIGKYDSILAQASIEAARFD